MAARKESSKSKSLPQISQIEPEAAITGGELYIRGKCLAPGAAAMLPPHVTVGGESAPVVIGSDSLVIVRVPEGASDGEVIVGKGAEASQVWSCDIGIPIAENLHPVASPTVDDFGNIYTTFSGSRGQKVPVAVYKIDLNFNMRPFINDMMNATGIAAGKDGLIYISTTTRAS